MDADLILRPSRGVRRFPRHVADLGLTTVKFLHIASAMLWLGGSTMILTVVNPLMRRRQMRERVSAFVELGKFARVYFPVAGLLTVVTGFELARQITGSLNPFAWDEGYPGGDTLQLAFILALVAFVVGGANAPMQKKLGAMMQQPWTPRSDQEAETVFMRLMIIDVADMILLYVVTFLMIVANLGGL